jgi:hypothetical protein
MLTSKLYRNIVKAWNDDADEYNQWDELDECEKIEFAYLCGTKWSALKQTEGGGENV